MTTPISRTTFSAVGLGSENLPATLEFYRMLGVQIPADADREPHVEVTVPGTVRLMWDSLPALRQADPDTEPSNGHGVALAFDCGTPEEVDRTYERIVAGGYRGTREPWDAFWGQRYACVLDPDGVAVDLFASLPG